MAYVYNVNVLKTENTIRLCFVLCYDCILDALQTTQKLDCPKIVL